MTADPAALRDTVVDLLSRTRGRRADVDTLTVRPSSAKTLFPVHELCVTLADGEQLRMFLKCLSTRQPDHPDKQCRDREVRIYDELFNDAALPVPRYFGFRHDRSARAYELFLECIDGDVLNNHSYEHWFAAARRLAHLHKHFAPRAVELGRLPWLLRFDAEYLLGWARRALLVVGDQSPELSRQLEPIVGSYRRVADLIARQPATLVHNDLAPKNVIVDCATNPARICFVDWEMAGIGCGVLDLAHLKYGMAAEDDRTICAAYASELAGTGLLPRDSADIEQLTAACCLHKNVFRLARSRDWGVPPESVTQWIDECRAIWDTL